VIRCPTGGCCGWSLFRLRDAYFMPELLVLMARLRVFLLYAPFVVTGALFVPRFLSVFFASGVAFLSPLWTSTPTCLPLSLCLVPSLVLFLVSLVVIMIISDSLPLLKDCRRCANCLFVTSGSNLSNTRGASRHGSHSCLLLRTASQPPESPRAQCDGSSPTAG